MKRDYIFFIIPALVVIILDQVSKLIVAGSIKHYESIPVIEGFLNLVHVRNRGMAFGLMNRPDAQITFYILIAVTIAAVILLFFWFNSLKGRDRKLILGISLIVGGAIGNLIDRVRFKEVIDFLDFFIGKYHWPAFNLADSSITVGALWVVINIFFFSSSNDKKTD